MAKPARLSPLQCTIQGPNYENIKKEVYKFLEKKGEKGATEEELINLISGVIKRHTVVSCIKEKL